MAFLARPVPLTTADQTIYECPVGQEASLHGLVFGGAATATRTVTVRTYNQRLGSTLTLGTMTVPPGTPSEWPKPINMEPGDRLIAAVDVGGDIAALASVFEQGGSAPVAAGFNPRGAYDANATYQANDVVTFVVGGLTNAYVALRQVTGVDPTNTSDWMYQAGEGAQGTPGQDGADGADGAGAASAAQLTVDNTSPNIAGNDAQTVFEELATAVAGLGSPVAADISDATATGIALIKAADATVARGAIGAVSTARNVNAGAGMIGGGNLAADRTLGIDFAVPADVRASQSDKPLDMAALDAGYDWVPEAPGATFTLDASTGRAFAVDLAQNSQFDGLLNAKPGVVYLIEVTQNGGVRTLSYGAGVLFDGGAGSAPELPGTAGAITLMTAIVLSGGATLVKLAAQEAKL